MLTITIIIISFYNIVPVNIDILIIFILLLIYKYIFKYYDKKLMLLVHVPFTSSTTICVRYVTSQSQRKTIAGFLRPALC